MDNDIGNDFIKVASIGDINQLQKYIDDGADVNFQEDDEQNTALHVASTNGHLNIVNALINAGANVNLTNSDNETPLFIAVANDHLDIVNILIRTNANVNIRDVQGETPLSTAALLGELEVVKILLEAGADMNEKNNNGETALDLAKQLKHNDVENFLRSYPTLKGIRMLKNTNVLSNIDFTTLDDIRDYSEQPNGGKRRRKTRRTNNKRRKTRRTRKARKARKIKKTRKL